MSTVQNQLASGNPIYSHFTRVSGAHAVAIRGITHSGTNVFYSLMDPNVDSYVSIYVSHTAQSNPVSLVYSTSYGYTYNWSRAFY